MASVFTLMGYVACYAARDTDRMHRQDGDRMDDSDRQDTDRQATGEAESELLMVPDAAQRLGVTPDAVRARLHRGTLEGIKVEGQWRVRLPVAKERQDATAQPTGNQQDTTAGRQDGDRTRQDAATVDLAPLAAVIADLSRQLEERDRRIQEQHDRLEELAGQEAMWRTHALHLQGRVEQLEALTSIEAGESSVSASEGDEDPGDVDDGSASQEGVWGRLVRLLTGR